MAVHLVPVEADLSLLHSRRVPHLSQTVSRELFVDVIAKIRSGGQHQGQKAIKPWIPFASTKGSGGSWSPLRSVSSVLPDSPTTVSYANSFARAACPEEGAEETQRPSSRPRCAHPPLGHPGVLTTIGGRPGVTRRPNGPRRARPLWSANHNRKAPGVTRVPRRLDSCTRAEAVVTLASRPNPAGLRARDRNEGLGYGFSMRPLRSLDRPRLLCIA